MRLDHLKIDGFKNLRNFELDVDECHPFLVLVGQNGSGKSNLLEALVVIFRNLDLGEVCSFSFELRYQVQYGAPPQLHKIRVQGDEGKAPSIQVDGRELPRAEFMRLGSEKRGALPSFVFGYYSGTGDRFAAHFKKHQERFYRELKSPDAHPEALPLRRLFLTDTIHGQFVLLAFFGEHDNTARNFLLKHLGIQALDSIHFVINKPVWASRTTEDRFWETTGTPRVMLERLEQLSMATTRSVRKIDLDFRRQRSVECWNFLLDQDGFFELAADYKSAQELFAALESVHISDLLLELRVNVRVETAHDSISFRELSEGEQQLLLVLGLLRFTREEGALFLLDEPDTHLNPAWSVQYLDFMKELVGGLDVSQVVLATHDPLLFSGLVRDQVRVLMRDKGLVTANRPVEDPRGMGVEAILTSELFGLRSSLDLHTLASLDRRRALEVKKVRSSKESTELQELNETLEGIDYALDAADPLYPAFVRAMTKWQVAHGMLKVTLTGDEQEAQRVKALEILDELKKEKT
ncbi:MAG: hypothetical protein QOJ65_851 [Fimbriimonadaceae bacterium]|jgi:predicted ATPase|nr:hypothetical protein [Fimbriimonadaceae bacterium]